MTRSSSFCSAMTLMLLSCCSATALMSTRKVESTAASSMDGSAARSLESTAARSMRHQFEAMTRLLSCCSARAPMSTCSTMHYFEATTRLLIYRSAISLIQEIETTRESLVSDSTSRFEQ